MVKKPYAMRRGSEIPKQSIFMHVTPKDTKLIADNTLGE